MKRILILGFGVTGKAVYRYLADKPVKVVIYDEKVHDDELDIWRFERLKEVKPLFDLAIRSPGISQTSEVYALARLLAKEVISEIEFAYRLLQKAHPIYIGVTGTNGKTTQCSMIYEVLKDDPRPVYLAGNIGTPLIALVGQIPSSSIIIVELSSFQLEDIVHFRPDFAIITNLEPNHLDEVINYDCYLASKKRLVLSMGLKEVLLVHETDRHFFKDVNVNVVMIEPLFQRRQLTLSSLNLPGEHNREHAKVALLVADIFGVDLDKARQNLATMLPLPYRMERVDISPFAAIAINDSKSTNIASTNQCLATFSDRPRLLILGGIAKSDNFEALRIEENDQIWAYGQARFDIQKAWPKAHICETLVEVLEAIKAQLNREIYLLFSPACSSFDQFANYLVRGRYFKEYLKEMLR